MVDSKQTTNCCTPQDSLGCCRLEALIGIDERGQMILPKDTRERAGIKPGEKLAVVSAEKDGEICCLLLMKASELDGMVKGKLEPVFKSANK